MGDDGVGVRVIQELETRYQLPQNVSLVDGGTLGLALLPYFGADKKMLLVDAAELGERPGTVRMLQGEECITQLDAPKSVHDLGLSDLLAAARLTGCFPAEMIVWCVQPGAIQLGTELSKPVADRIGWLAQEIARQLRSWGADIRTQAKSGPAAR